MRGAGYNSLHLFNSLFYLDKHKSEFYTHQIVIPCNFLHKIFYL